MRAAAGAAEHNAALATQLTVLRRIAGGEALGLVGLRRLIRRRQNSFRRSVASSRDPSQLPVVDAREQNHGGNSAN